MSREELLVLLLAAIVVSTSKANAQEIMLATRAATRYDTTGMNFNVCDIVLDTVWLNINRWKKE